MSIVPGSVVEDRAQLSHGMFVGSTEGDQLTDSSRAHSGT